MSITAKVTRYTEGEGILLTVQENGQVVGRVVFPVEVARDVAADIVRVCDEIKPRIRPWNPPHK